MQMLWGEGAMMNSDLFCVVNHDTVTYTLCKNPYNARILFLGFQVLI